jgi:hypothetical protein
VAASSNRPHPERRLRLVESDRPDVDVEPDLEVVLDDDDPDAVLQPLLLEAELHMRKVRRALDAEMWASELFGMVTLAIPTDDVVDREEASTQIAVLLVDHAARLANGTGLAMLRALSCIGPQVSRSYAVDLAEKLAATGVKDRVWVPALGAPQLGSCWRYGDLEGRQEVVTATFRYGRKEHALSVLIDHDLGGGVKDCWLADDADGVLAQTLVTVGPDPQTEFQMIDWPLARLLVERAVRRPECPVEPDQVEDVAMTRELLLSRLALAGEPAGY